MKNILRCQSIGIIIFMITIQSLIRLLCANEDPNFLRFPDRFKIGVATSAYQVEGAWNITDKSPSNWDEITHSTSHMIVDRSNGDIACDFYHKYKDDIQLMKNTGFHHFRLSLSWARILPTGFANKVSSDGIQYYKNLLDELHANGIEPIVTLYHFDHPSILEKFGGWMNELMVDYFADYARVVFKELGSRVKMWSSLNEPSVFCAALSHGKTYFPPALNRSKIDQYICGHNALKAHARAYRIYDQEFRNVQNGKISIVLSCRHHFPINENETESANIAHQYDCGWFAHPIFSEEGDYPSIMRQRIDENSKLQGYPRSRLPVFSSFWVEYIKGTFDYFALNHYSSNMVQQVAKDNQTGWYKDSGILLSYNESWEDTASGGRKIVPEGLGGVLRKIKSEYNNPPVIIMENGRAGHGNQTEIEDIERINFLYSYMKEMLLAIHRDGCHVIGYTVWSLLDNFEWFLGYTKRYGIVHVDFTHPNRTRTPRRTVEWLKDVIRKQKLISLDEFNNSRIVF